VRGPLALLAALALGLVAGSPAADAQPAAKAPRIGYLRAEAPPAADLEGFRQGLREHGYAEGKDIVVEYRWADGSEERLRSLAAELVRLRVDLIATSAPAATRAAMEATATVPIVFANVAFPDQSGLVTSYLRPGGNVTGVAFIGPEYGKRLERLA
jgi:putative ABC transport system substrate-binding protein